MYFSDASLHIESFVHLLPLPIQDTNPTDYQWRFTKHNKTDELLKCQQIFPDRHFNKILDDKEIICYVVSDDDQDTQLKFALTDSMIWPTLHWFHIMLGNLCTCHMHAALQARYHHPNLRIHTEHLLCDKCQHLSLAMGYSLIRTLLHHNENCLESCLEHGKV